MTFREYLLEARTITPQQPLNNVFIVLGLPGSGKSTLYRNGLINAQNTVMLTPDRWIELLSKKENIDIKNPIRTAELYDRVIKRHNRQAMTVIKQHAQSNFIIETLGRDMFRLKDILIRTKKQGMNIVVIHVHVSLETAKKGNLTRVRSVPEDIIEDAYKRIEKNFNFLVTSPEVDEAWRVDNDARPGYKDFRTSNFIRRIK